MHAHDYIRAVNDHEIRIREQREPMKLANAREWERLAKQHERNAALPGLAKGERNRLLRTAAANRAQAQAELRS